MSPSQYHTGLTISSLLVLLIPLLPCLQAANVDTTTYFSERLIQDYGTNGSLSTAQLELFLQDYREAYKPRGGVFQRANYSRPTNSCDINFPLVDYDACIDEWCMSAEDILRYHFLPLDVALVPTQVPQISPALLKQIKTATCWEKVETELDGHIQHSSSAEVWGFGLLAVTIINVCALLGACFKPLMNKSGFKRFLMYMIGLAVGALSANGLLVLIPEALGLTEDDGPLGEIFLFRMVTVMGGTYLFFLIERFLKIINKTCFKNNDDETTAVHSHNPEVNAVTKHGSKDTESGEVEGHENKVEKEGGEKKKKSLRDIKSVAWMIIFGDGFHNFIDGLSIGAAFVKSPLTGVSVSLAILCEELPHELGDFAILLNAGMTIKQGLCFNFLSACTCYLGFIVGVVIGEFTSGSHWVFALAGGMFLYISLVDMLPEMNADAEEEEKKGHTMSVFFIQNAGLLTGFGVIFILALYGGEIDLEKTAGVEI